MYFKNLNQKKMPRAYACIKQYQSNPPPPPLVDRDRFVAVN